jgi:hypothetical protein
VTLVAEDRLLAHGGHTQGVAAPDDLRRSPLEPEQAHHLGLLGLYWLALRVRLWRAVAYCCAFAARYATSCVVALRCRSRLMVEAERPSTNPVAR